MTQGFVITYGKNGHSEIETWTLLDSYYHAKYPESRHLIQGKSVSLRRQYYQLVLVDPGDKYMLQQGHGGGV